MESRSTEILYTKKLDHLPLAAACMRYLEVGQTVDEMLPPHVLNHVSTGDCVQALVLAILSGQHALYRVADCLSEYDLEVVFQRPVEAGWFQDERLGNALDDLAERGLESLYSAIVSKAILKYSLELSRLHFDTTSLSVYGAYEGHDEWPLVTFGYSKDRRPDLKQVLFGMTVTADGRVPLRGRITSGNQADCVENRFNLASLRQVVPDLSKSLLVADSKFFTGETLELSHQSGVRFVTLVPNTVALRGELVSSPLPLRTLLTKPGRQKGRVETFRGCSVEKDYTYRTAEGRKVTRRLRFLVVESTVLSKLKAGKLEASLAKEAVELSRLAERTQKRVYACEEDALRCARRIRERPQPKYHALEAVVRSVAVAAKRARAGRPRAGERRSLSPGWVVELGFSRQDDKLAQLKEKEGRFVLATNQLAPGALSDAGMLQAYKGQPAVENNFKWAKSPAAVAPIFLKTPTRIAALALVYLVALMVHTLMERQVRKMLKQRGRMIRGNKGPTDNPTGEVIFRALRGIASVVVRVGHSTRKTVVNLNPTHQLVVSLFDFDISIYEPPTENCHRSGETT